MSTADMMSGSLGRQATCPQEPCFGGSYTIPLEKEQVPAVFTAPIQREAQHPSQPDSGSIVTQPVGWRELPPVYAQPNSPVNGQYAPPRYGDGYRLAPVSSPSENRPAPSRRSNLSLEDLINNPVPQQKPEGYEHKIKPSWKKEPSRKKETDTQLQSLIDHPIPQFIPTASLQSKPLKQVKKEQFQVLQNLIDNPVPYQPGKKKW